MDRPVLGWYLHNLFSNLRSNKVVKMERGEPRYGVGFLYMLVCGPWRSGGRGLLEKQGVVYVCVKLCMHKASLSFSRPQFNVCRLAP